ncbi:DUF397 domain-containing protein [Streptomyces triticagri]|nr:DUF397 domain-containing protein [Streptomyces triticagri]
MEVADGHPGLVPVRDSKVPDGVVLTFTAGVWEAFIGEVRAAGHRG